MSAIIGDNLNEGNFRWQGDQSFHSTEHQFFYEDFEKQNDYIRKASAGGQR